MTTEMRQVTVDLGERSYPIYLGERLLDRAGEFFDRHSLSRKSPHMIVTDEHVAPLHLRKVADSMRSSGYTVVEAVVPAGESSKSLARLEELIGIALDGRLDRNSAIIALGGGVVGDLAGFAAASFMRGVRFVQMPTTILAHDSSVGGKVAVNHPKAKNMIGAFYQPDFVLFDLSALGTLPPREVRAGLAEVIKHGLIWDERFVDWCEEHANRLLSLDMDALGHALHTGCRVKAEIVSRDERENDLRAILNLGHTIGHALEKVAGYGELVHGEAISIGMAAACRLSGKFGYDADGQMARRVERLLRTFGLPVAIPRHFAAEEIMSALKHDKKFREGRMVFVVPTRIGKVEIRRDVPEQWVWDIIEEMKE